MLKNLATAEVRNLLWDRFVSLFPVMRARLPHEYGERVSFSDQAGFSWFQAYVYHAPKNSDWIFFKSDNIIVNPLTLEMVVNDSN